MSSLEKIEARLKGLKGIREIVNSMKALSALSIRKAESLLPSIREYSDSIEDAFAQLLEHFPEVVQRGLEGGPEVFYLVLTSEQGLCGAYNEEMIRAVEQEVNKRPGGLVITGTRGIDLAATKGLPVLLGLKGPVSVEGIDLKVMEVVRRLLEILPGGNPQLYLLFAYYRRKAEYTIIRQRVIPPPLRKISRRMRQRRVPLLYMEPEEILGHLFRQYLVVSLYRAFVEALASENASRLFSMERASKNIDDKLQELSELYNYLRQEEITNETIEVSSGYEVLNR